MGIIASVTMIDNECAVVGGGEGQFAVLRLSVEGEGRKQRWRLSPLACCNVGQWISYVGAGSLRHRPRAFGRRATREFIVTTCSGEVCVLAALRSRARHRRLVALQRQLSLLESDAIAGRRHHDVWEKGCGEGAADDAAPVMDVAGARVIVDGDLVAVFPVLPRATQTRLAAMVNSDVAELLADLNLLNRRCLD